jgi:hypothetical protein
VSLPAQLDDSKVLAEIQLNPLMIPQARRLAQYAALWDKYKWLELKLHYVPSCGTGTDGALGMCADPDVFDGYTQLEGDELLSKMNANPHNINPSVIRVATLDVKDKRFFDRVLFMEPDANSDPRNYIAGKLVIANEGLLTAGTYGRLFLEWKIRFEEPNIEPLIEGGPGIAYIAGLSGTYVSATYPWGDFTLIKDTGPGANTGSRETALTEFYSDAVLGSVIKFKQQGFYLVGCYRTGVAMGTGAFSGAVFTGCQALWQVPPMGIVGQNASLSNGGSTASMWILCVTVDQPNATLSKTGDAGVTHTTSTVFVASDNTPYPILSQALVTKQVEQALRSLGLGALIDRSKSLKSIPYFGVDPPGEYAGTIQQGQGPSETIEFEGTTTLTRGDSVGNPLYVEVIDPTPPRSSGSQVPNRSAPRWPQRG